MANSRLRELGKAVGESVSTVTNGEWTEGMEYDFDNNKMHVTFSDGFQATYPNIDKKTAEDMMDGATTKDGRTGSVGAWLHQHPSVMRNYE